MHDPEYREQLIETATQWSSGLMHRLALDAGGISLFVRPAFEAWLTPNDWRATVTDIVVDECGQVYWMAEDGGFWALFRHEARTGLTERVIGLARSSEIDPRRLWLTPSLLWVFDFLGRRALGLARDTFQILHEIPVGPDFVEIAFDRRGAFHTLERRSGRWQVCRYDVPPADAAPVCIALEQCREPAAIAVAHSGDIFVYCSDLHRLLRIRAADRQQAPVGSSAIDALKEFRTAGAATPMEIDNRGVIYLASRVDPVLHQFDPFGSYLGHVRLPREIRAIVGMGFDAHNNPYLATDRGIATFSLSRAEIGEEGVYYTRTLDSGVQGGPWHRLTLAADVPPRTSVRVQQHASDDVALRRAVDAVFGSNRPVYEKREDMERLLGPRWEAGPTEVFQSGQNGGARPGDDLAMLVSTNRGRYLWLKVTLTTFDESNRPSVRNLRVLYPRTSYLRYLPGIYREDPVHAAFLERFLALFETVVHGLDREIDLLFRHFDPQLAPDEFLPWLASWINLTVEEDVPRPRIRRLIERSPLLYRRRGTPSAIAEFLEIYTGRRAFVVEDGARFEPIVLGSGATLGQHIILVGSAVRGFRVGDSSVVGKAALRTGVSAPEEPFKALAGRFTVVVDMPRTDFVARRQTLERILDDQKPAHTTCTLRLIADRAFAGVAILGAGAIVTDRQPYQVGVTPLGGAIAGSGGPGLRLERGAWVGSEAGLA
jgi:phage tail-like protein